MWETKKGHFILFFLTDRLPALAMEQESQQEQEGQQVQQQEVPSSVPQGYEHVTLIPNEGNDRGGYSNTRGNRFHGPQRRFGAAMGGGGATGYSGGAPWRGGGKNMYGKRRGDHGKQMRPQQTCEGYTGEQLYKPSFSEDPWACFCTE